MPVIFTPVRIDRMQQALGDAFAEATGLTVLWDDQEVPQQGFGASYVELAMVSAPTPHTRMHGRGTAFQPIDTVTLTIGAVGTARVGVVLNDFSYFADPGPGGTPTTVRDAIVAEINDPANIEPVTAAAVGADALTLTADHLGAIASLAIFGPITAGTPDRNDQWMLLVEGTQTALVNVQAYSKQREPRLGAPAIIQQCHAVLQSTDLLQRLRAYGVGVWGYTTPVNLNAIAGAHWETQQSFDLTVSARAYWSRPVDVVDTFEGTLNGGPFQVTDL